MSNKIFIYGPSGWGKTTSLRNLNPSETGIINADRKALSVLGMRKNYKTVFREGSKIPDLEKSNYVVTSKPDSVLKTLQVWEQRDDIKYIVIDTITHVMSYEFMRRIMDKGFDKFSELGDKINRILEFIRDSDKNFVVLAHNEVSLDADGNKINDVRSFGKLVKERIEIPSIFTIVLTPVVKRKDGKAEYLFQTQSEGTTSAKVPIDFDENDEPVEIIPYEMPNDIAKVFELLEKYEVSDQDV